MNLKSPDFVLLFLLIFGAPFAMARKEKVRSDNTEAFDRFVLALSWSPSFCGRGGSPEYPECMPGRRVGFAVREFLPQTASGRSLDSCAKTKLVPKTVVRLALPAMFRESLIQEQWATHGSCTGLTAFDYFSDLVQARASIAIPVQITSINAAIRQSPRWVEQQFAIANPQFPPDAFQASCSHSELDEVRVCLDKMLKPVQCPVAHETLCDVPVITILPPR
jgi:ribonuclease T2